MYGLIKQIEQVKNDPSLSGSEREERVQTLQEQLNTYRETYVQEADDDLTNLESEDEPNPPGNESTPTVNPSDEENTGDAHVEEAERDTHEETD